jgi:hypothetical protein
MIVETHPSVKDETDEGNRSGSTDQHSTIKHKGMDVLTFDRK